MLVSIRLRIRVVYQFCTSRSFYHRALLTHRNVTAYFIVRRGGKECYFVELLFHFFFFSLKKPQEEEHLLIVMMLGETRRQTSSNADRENALLIFAPIALLAPINSKLVTRLELKRNLTWDGVVMESCEYEWIRVRPSNINERILQIKNVEEEGKGKKKKEISFLERTYTSIKFSIDIVYLHYMRMTNWNIVSILNGGYMLHGSLIFNNDIIKRIIEIYPYDASLPHRTEYRFSLE